uniref:Uncharacterized protein n=1 Tax=Nocardioides aromaticivorans TaxID=200618 RepID=Q2HWI9_9ACTN|nr:hypothetical protein [Nocardioides aromaticivorans]
MPRGARLPRRPRRNRHGRTGADRGRSERAPEGGRVSEFVPAITLEIDEARASVAPHETVGGQDQFRVMGRKKSNRRESGDPSKRARPRPPAHRPNRSSSGFDYARFPPEASDRRSQAEYLIDKILHGTPDGRVAPAISASLRQHLVANPGDPERALLDHLNEQMAEAGSQGGCPHAQEGGPGPEGSGASDGR